MERGHLWRSAFKNNLLLLKLNGEGLTAELAARRPADGVASAAWILGHLVATRRSLIAMVGGSLPEDPAWARYGRGGSGEGAHLDWAGLVQAMEAMDAALKAAFQSVGDWDRPTPNPVMGVEQPLEQMVGFLYMHECYHLGQLGLIRKLLGLPGAI